jgi:hypothetical protein
MRTQTVSDVGITEPAILLRINQLYRVGMTSHALYEATRGVWVVAERRKCAKYALAVFRGLVKEVYEIRSWHKAGTTPYTTRPLDSVTRVGRWEFVGQLAPDAIRSRYVGRSVAARWKHGAANPILYVNC